MRNSLKKNLWLISLPICIMFFSGCTIPGTDIDLPFPDFLGSKTTEYENDILIIKDFKAIPSEVAPGQTVTLFANLQNKGSETIPFSDINVLLYDYCPGLFVIDGSEESELPSGSIYPEQQVQLTWKLRASEDVKVETTCPSDGMKAAVSYDYTTETMATISFIDEAEKNRRLQEGDYGTTTSQQTAGEGPVKTYIEVRDEQPIVSTSGSTNIIFQAKKKGKAANGFVKRESDSEDLSPKVSWDFVGSSDKTIDASLKKCLSENNGKFVLINGDSAEIPCEVDVPETTPDGKKYIEYSATMTTRISYSYEFRDYVKVSVKPKR